VAANDEWGYQLALGVNVVLILLAFPWAVVGVCVYVWLYV